MKQYLEYLEAIMTDGVPKSDRTGTGTVALFGYQMRFDLLHGFPLVTTKKIHTKSVIHELLWFLQGGTNTKYLNDNGVTIWDEWADEDGYLGPVYGAQWRDWNWFEPTGAAPDSFTFEYVDQITKLVDELKSNPFSRRHIVSAWNVAQLDKMNLPPCHLLFQCYVQEATLEQRNRWLEYGRTVRLDWVHQYDHDELDGFEVPRLILSLRFDIRSSDAFLGMPFNIASYAFLTHMLAQQCDYIPGTLVVHVGDAHIYSNHFEQVTTQLRREPKPLPYLTLNKAPSIFDYKYDDFKIVGYDPHPAISAPIAV